jgi:hypothetical protein
MPICRLLKAGAERHSGVDAKTLTTIAKIGMMVERLAPNVEYILLQLEIGTAAKSRQILRLRMILLSEIIISRQDSS